MQPNSPLKKEWQLPELTLIGTPVESGTNPHVKESTARSSLGNPTGSGHPGQPVFNQFNTQSAPDWTHALS